MTMKKEAGQVFTTSDAVPAGELWTLLAMMASNSADFRLATGDCESERAEMETAEACPSLRTTEIHDPSSRQPVYVKRNPYTQVQSELMHTSIIHCVIADALVMQQEQG